MTEKKEIKNFKAKVNVNTIVSLLRYPEVREYINKSLDDLALDNPDIRREPSAKMANRVVTRGQILTFGEKIELNENGHVVVYPKEVFDQYSKRIVEMPCQTAGNLTVEFNKSINSMPPEEAEAYEVNRERLTQRFIYTPIMEKIQ